MTDSNTFPCVCQAPAYKGNSPFAVGQNLCIIPIHCFTPRSLLESLGSFPAFECVIHALNSSMSLSLCFIVAVIIYLFGCGGSSWLFSSCDKQGLLSSWASYCGGFSYCRTWALGGVGFSSCGSQALEHSARSCDAWA